MNEGYYIAIVVMVIMLVGARVKNDGYLTDATMQVNMLPGGSVIERSRAIAEAIEQLKVQSGGDVNVVSIMKIDTTAGSKSALHTVHAMLFQLLLRQHAHSLMDPK